MLLTTNILWMRRRIQQTQHPTSQLEQVSDDEPCYIPGTRKPKRLTARAWRKEMGKRTMKTSNSISHFEVLIPADTLKPLVNMDPHMVLPTRPVLKRTRGRGDTASVNITTTVPNQPEGLVTQTTESSPSPNLAPALVPRVEAPWPRERRRFTPCDIE